MTRWIHAVLVLPLAAGVWMGCHTRAKDAGDFAEKALDNFCFVQKKCAKFEWNRNEWKNIQDCVDEFVDNSGASDIDEYADNFDDNCPDFDKEMANDCLSQMIGEYNNCTPAHDYNDADFDCQDDPCQNVCGECSGGGWGDGLLPNPWVTDPEL